MNALRSVTGFRSPILLAGCALAALVACAAAARADDLKDGRTALEAGQYDAAIRSFEKAASQGYAEGRAGVGLVYLRRFQFAKAQEQFEMAQKMDAGLAMAWYGLGEVARRQDDCGGAMPNLRKAVDLDHKFPEAQLALGDCLTQLKHFDDAIAALSPGLNWGTKWRPRFLIALGNVELGRDSLRDAGIYFTKAQQEAPDDPATSRALGDFYVARGTFELAIPPYERALQLDSTDVDLRFGYGRALAYTERYNEAIEQYKWVVDHNPDYAAAQLALGDVFYRAGVADPKRYAEARPYLEKYVQLEPKDAKGWSLLGRDDYYLKLKDDAVTNLEKALALGDKTKDAYTILARAYVEQQQWQKALDAYGKGDPNTDDLFRIGQVYVFLNQPDKADSAYRAIVAKDSTTSLAKYALLEMGKIRFRAQDYPAAAALLERRIALDPTNDEAFYYEGLAYKEMKRLPEAAAALRKAAALAPGKCDRLFWLGVTLSADSADAADEAFANTVACDSTSKNAGIAYQQLGFHQLLHKNWPAAIGYLNRAAAIDDKNVQTLVWLGQASQNSGNRAKAIEYYRKVLELKPGQPDATRGLKSLGQ